MHLPPLDFPELQLCPVNADVPPFLRGPDNASLAVTPEYTEIRIYSRGMCPRALRVCSPACGQFSGLVCKRERKKPFEIGFQPCSALCSSLDNYSSCSKNHLQFIDFCICRVYTLFIYFFYFLLREEG